MAGTEKFRVAAAMIRQGVVAKHEEINALKEKIGRDKRDKILADIQKKEKEIAELEQQIKDLEAKASGV